MKQLNFKKLPGLYSVSKMVSECDIISQCQQGPIFAVIRDTVETTVVFETKTVVADNYKIKQEDNWVMLHLTGEFAFGETGIILSAIQPLSSNNIGVFILSTFSSDLLLIKEEDFDNAVSYLKNSGHNII